MRIRRYEIDYIFKTLNESQLHKVSQYKDGKFICIPRYNICINLRISSIHFFFTHVYKIRTYKTYFIWCLLIIVVSFPFLHGILNLVKLKHQLVQTNRYKNFNWNSTDLIYVEWHFFGVFSEAEQTVTHVLAKEAYKERFFNELNARKNGEQFIELFPELLRFSNDPKYYVEELAVDSGNQLITAKQFKKSQKKLKKINKKTIESIALDTYYNKLLDRIGFIENKNLNLAYQGLQRQMESLYLYRNTQIELALVHGDFNRGQILVKDNDIKIIDWGDGGVLNRYFDYISIAINRGTDHKFKHKNFPKDFSVLKSFYRKKLKADNNNKNLYVLITLLEILAISKGEFEAKEGAYPRWLTSVANNQGVLVQA